MVDQRQLPADIVQPGGAIDGKAMGCDTPKPLTVTNPDLPGLQRRRPPVRFASHGQAVLNTAVGELGRGDLVERLSQRRDLPGVIC